MNQHLLWPQECVQILRDKWSTSSASEIVDVLAREHRFFVTRNAVMGKVRRLGLPDKRKIVAKSRVPRSSGEPAGAKLPRPKAPPQPSAVPFKPRVVDSSPRHLTLTELTDDVCKWECSGLDDPAQYTFCGQPATRQWCCEAHARIAFVSSKDARFRRQKEAA